MSSKRAKPFCKIEAHTGQHQACTVHHQMAGCSTERSMPTQEMIIIGVGQAIATHLAAADVKAMIRSSRTTGANLGCGMTLAILSILLNSFGAGSLPCCLQRRYLLCGSQYLEHHEGMSLAVGRQCFHQGWLGFEGWQNLAEWPACGWEKSEF